MAAPAALAYDGDESWMQFGQSGGGDAAWEQSFDRSFARQWESHPPRGHPTLSSRNIPLMKAAIKRYARIVAEGGWRRIPALKLYTGVRHRAVALLRQRLEMTGDLEQRGGYADMFDYYVEKALKRFQVRHGLSPTGALDKRTLTALNVPASARLRQLRTNLVRVRALAAAAAKKYVMVNIPAAQIEAVENDRIVSRHSAVVGKIDRQTPILRSQIYELNFNPVWTLPPTVIRKDLIPKGRELRRSGRDVLLRYGIDAYGPDGQKLNPLQINWNSEAVRNYIYKQKPGEDNPLGYVKINFHNKYAVYMHDTPSKSLFSRNFRAASSGCVRVQNIQQLVTWLLEDNPGWDRARVAFMKRSGERLDVRLKKRVPVYFVYVTAWATEDGMVHFRRDLYRRDGAGVTASAY